MGEGYSCKNIYVNTSNICGLEGGSCRRVERAQIWGCEKSGRDGPSLAVVYRLVSECSVPKSEVWVGLGVAFLWVLSSFSLECGVPVPVVLGGGEVGGLVSRGSFVWSVWDFAG